MESRIYNVNLQSGYNTLTYIGISQYDAGVPLQFNVYDGATAASFPAGTTAKIQGVRPSGVGFSIACTLTDNVVTVDTVTDMTGEAGKFPVEIRFTASGVDVGTVNFVFLIEKAPHPDGTIDADILHQQTFVEKVEAMETELEDIRTGTDGTTYQTAGEAVRSQIENVHDEIGDLAALETENKSSLVAAINEANQNGGSGNGITVVELASEMTDTTAVYLYNGTETGYTAGHWYFYNTGTSAWTDGGEYTGWETVDTALENFLEENAQEIGTLTVVVGSTTYTYNGSANVSVTLPVYDGGVS